MIKAKNTYSKLLLLINIMLIILSAFTMPQLLAAQIFALIYVVITYIKYNKDTVKNLYFNIFLYAILNSSFVVNILGKRMYGIYIFLLIYIIYYAITIILNNGKQLRELKSKLFKNKYYVFFAIFIVYSIVSVFWAQDKQIAINKLKDYLIIYALVLVVINQNNNIKDIKESVNFMLLLSIGIIFVSFLQIAGINLQLPNHFVDSNVSPLDFPYIQHVPVVFFYNPNNFSLWLSILLITIFIYFLFVHSNKKKISYLVFYVLTLVVLVFSMCRTSWITSNIIFLFLLVIFIINLDIEKIKKVVACGLLTISLIVGVSYIPSMQQFYGKLNETPGMQYLGKNVKEGEMQFEVGMSGSTNLRYTLIYNTINGVIKDKHYLGFGVGNSFVYNKQMDNTNKVYNTHSLWFEILGDFGIPIFIYCIIIYCYMCLDIYKTYRTHKKSNVELSKYALLFGAAAFELIFLVFAPSTVTNMSSFWVILSLIFAFTIKVSHNPNH